MNEPMMPENGDPPVRGFPTVSAQSLDPDPLLLDLLASEPVSRVRLPYGEPCWLVTRHDDVRLVLSDHRFSRAATVHRDVARTTERLPLEDSILAMDPPRHTRIRRLVSLTFTARRVSDLRVRAQGIVDGLLDDIERTGPPADLVENLALPLPIAMICELLGVPFDDRSRFRGWADTFMTSSGYSLDQLMDAHAQICAYLADMVDRRREHPTDDLLGALVTARDEDENVISEGELISLALALLVAGYETTASQLSKFLLALFQHPDQLELLRAQPELVPNAIEELMRLIPLSSGTSLAYVATEDVELSGVTVYAGDAVVASTAAANRDPAVFADPNRLDVTREGIVHFGFGHGSHFCLGAHLARMEMQVAIASLLARFPNLRLAVPDDDVPWKDGSAVWGLEHLPVAF
jgi:nocardicin N-oxygenase